jgi:hypothetical protein
MFALMASVSSLPVKTLLPDFVNVPMMSADFFITFSFSISGQHHCQPCGEPAMERTDFPEATRERSEWSGHAS